MAFKGDVAQIPLTNILQALMLNGQEGILTLQCSAFERRIRILKQGVRPLNFTRDDPDLLKQVLLKQKFLTEAQVQNIFSTWNPRKGCPGDFLIRRRIITQQNVEREIRNQLENLLLDIFLVPNLKYEFKVGQQEPGLELFSPEGLGESIVFNANSVLMEAARREDDWKRFRKVIPDGTELYKVEPGADLNKKSLHVSSESLKAIRPFLGGETTVDGIIAATTLSTFEVYEALFPLRQKKLIRPLHVSEKKTLAEKFRRSLRTEEAIAIYLSILLSAPKNLDARLKLIDLLENAGGRESELVEHYMVLAEALKDSDPDQCIEYLRKVLRLTPHHLLALESLFRLCYGRGKQREAMEAIRAGITASKAAGRLEHTTGLLHKLVNLCPQEAFLFHELADAYLAVNDADSAVSHLKSAARIYREQGDSGRLQKVLDKISRLNPSEGARLKRRISVKRGRKPRSIVKVMLATTFFAGVLALVSFFSLSEYYSRTAFADLLEEVETHKGKGSFESAIRSVRSFCETFPYSTVSAEAEELIGELADLAEKKQAADQKALEARRATAESDMMRARIQLSRGEYDKARQILDGIDSTVLLPERAEEHRALRLEVEQYYTDAKELLERAKIARKRQDVRLSHRLLKRILTEHPLSDSAKAVRLPVEIKTTPPGADLLIGGNKAGVTPGIFDFHPSSLASSIVLRKKGYEPINLANPLDDRKLFDPLESHQLVLTFRKSLGWKVSAGAPVECSPTALGDKVFFGTRSGVVFCVKQDTGAVLWKTQVPSKMDLTGGLGLWNNVLYFGSFDGKVYAMDADTGQFVREAAAASREKLPIKAAPSSANENGLVAFNCGEKLLAAYSLASGKIEWSIPFPDSGLLGQPLSQKNSLYVVTRKGQVFHIDCESGNVLRHSDLEIGVRHPAILSNRHIFLATREGTILAFGLEEWKTVWSHAYEEPLAGPVTTDGASLIISTSSGKLSCLSLDGEVKWERDVGQTIPGGGIIFRNVLLAGTHEGRILCLDTWTGNERWELQTGQASRGKQKGMLTRGMVSQGRFFIGSEDHSFYSVTLD